MIFKRLSFYVSVIIEKNYFLWYCLWPKEFQLYSKYSVIHRNKLKEHLSGRESDCSKW